VANIDITLERRAEENRTSHIGGLMLTPCPDEDYWAYRVRLTDRQAVLGFPKFGTIGVGFAVEDADWNTNLPYTCDAEMICNHIWENVGDESIERDIVLAAICAIQEAARADRGEGVPSDV